MKIAIAGTRYVALSNGILLAQHNDEVCLDIVPAKVAMPNRKESPIEDADMEKFLKNKPLNFRATLSSKEAYEEAEFIIIANRHTDALSDVADKVMPVTCLETMPKLA